MAMNFTVNLAQQIVEIQIGDDVIRRRIEADDKGYRFFYVPNLLNNPTSSKLNRIFTMRIKDAVETIRNGDGDALHVSNLFGTINVKYFLDRNYGSDLREIFLKGWEGVKFAYAIRYGGTCELDTDNNFSSSTIHIKYFDTEFEATNYLSDLQKNAVQYAKKYRTLDENKQSCFWSENSFSEAMESLILFELERIENPNVTCPLRVVQTICRE